MRKKILTVAFISFILFTVKTYGQNVGVYSVAFYNVENLFDTEPGDYPVKDEFTPTGMYNWTEDKYQKKLDNIALVISQLARNHCPAGPAVIGLAEVENKKVLDDMVNNATIKNIGYQIIHYDSPDRRGIDVGLLYNPALFHVLSSKVYPYRHWEDSLYVTRDQLLVTGTLAGDITHIIVNHWPSRYGGSKSSPLREQAGKLTKHIADSLYNADKDCKIIIMGDFNDDPVDKSLRESLGAKRKQSDVKQGGLFNAMWAFYDKGIGSLSYQGKWSLFDQIIVSESLLGKDYSSLKFWKAEIFNKDFLIQKEGKNKGYPLRTFSGNSFINGFSDHLPVLIYLLKNL